MPSSSSPPPAEHRIYTNRREVAAKEATLEYKVYDLNMIQFVMVVAAAMMTVIIAIILIIMNMV